MDISVRLSGSYEYEIRNEEQLFEYFMDAVWVKLPADLKHTIFLEFADMEVQSPWKKQLTKLSVMSRASCRIFRPALFSSLSLRSLDDLRTLYSILTSSVSTWLTDYILHIYLWPTDSRAQPSLMRSPIFMALLRHMRTLRMLRIWEGPPLDLALPRSPTYRPLRALRNLQVLRIENSVFSTFSSPLRFLEYLPSLRRIELHCVAWPVDHIPQWTPYVCDSDFQKIETIHATWPDKNQSPTLPFWIFTAASTHYLHFRRRQFQVNFSDLAQLPRQEMMRFASTFQNILLAQTPQDSTKNFDYTFQRRCQQEGTSPWLIS